MEHSFILVYIERKEKPIQMAKLIILLEFHFQRQPKLSLFISSGTKCGSTNCREAKVLLPSAPE